MQKDNENYQKMVNTLKKYQENNMGELVIVNNSVNFPIRDSNDNISFFIKMNSLALDGPPLH